MAEITMPLAKLQPPQSYGRRVLKRFLKHKPAVAGLCFLLLLALVIILGPLFSPYSYDGQDFNLIGSPGPMNAQHWLGTDELGRDALTRLIYGGRVSLAVGLAGAIIATLAGTLVGAVSGFYGGWTDAILMRLTDVMLSISMLPLVLLLSGLFRPSPPLLVAIVGMLIWMGTARLMFRHILPNAIGPITVSATLAVGIAIMLESALSFLGFGIQPPVPTWGNCSIAPVPG